MDDTIEALEDAGAEIVDPADIPLDGWSAAEFPALLCEFKTDIADLLEDVHGPRLPEDAPGSDRLQQRPSRARVRRAGIQLELADLRLRPGEGGRDADCAALRAIATPGAQAAIDDLMAAEDLDAIIAPTNGPAWVTDPVNGDLGGDFSTFIGSSGPPAVAGYANVTVPAGFVGPLPVGVSFIGGRWDEPALIGLAYARAGDVRDRRSAASIPGSERRSLGERGVTDPTSPLATIDTMPTSLVTGGAGFLGSHLCEALLQRGHRVICLDNLVVSSLENIEHLRDDAFAFVNHDVIDPIAVDEPVDYVYHLAALASPIDYLRMPLHSLKTGSYGTHHALGLAKFKRARFLLTSTSEVYGDPEVHPQPETYWGNVNPIGPRGVYDEAKRYAEALVMAYHRQQGVDTGIVRIFNTYGSRMRPNDGRAIPTFLRQALDGKPVTVFGDGSQTRSFCYVDDLIRGIVLLAESGEHLPVNLGNPDEKTLLELAETIIRLTGSSSEIVFEALPVDDPQVRQPDITRAKQLLGWQPEVELEDGLRKTIASLGHEAAVSAA